MIRTHRVCIALLPVMLFACFAFESHASPPAAAGSPDYVPPTLPELDLGGLGRFHACKAKPERPLSAREQCQIASLSSRCTPADDCQVACIAGIKGQKLGGACSQACLFRKWETPRLKGYSDCDALETPFKVSIVPISSGMDFQFRSEGGSHSSPFKGERHSISSGLLSQSATFYMTLAQTFYVVLTNTSDRPQYVFETWNSWGYQTVSLEATTQTGKTFLMTVKPQAFTRNFPSTFLIPPGEQQVFPIRLDDEWEGRPPARKARTGPYIADTEFEHVAVKAIYQVLPSDEAASIGVWTGKIDSTSYDFDLNRIDASMFR